MWWVFVVWHVCVQVVYMYMCGISVYGQVVVHVLVHVASLNRRVVLGVCIMQHVCDLCALVACVHTGVYVSMQCVYAACVCTCVLYGCVYVSEWYICAHVA